MRRAKIVCTIGPAVESVEKITEEEIKESKELMIGQRKINMEESLRVMQELLFGEIGDKAERYYEYEKRINAVKMEEVKRLAREMIKDYSSAVVMPK